MWMVSLLAFGVVHRHELDTRVHKGRHEGQISRKPIKLGNDQSSFVLAASIDGPRHLGTIRFLTALNLDKFAHQLPSTAIEIIHDGLLLGLQTEAAAALAVGADTAIGDEAANGPRTHGFSPFGRRC
jgi:hypothetical protein